MGLELREFFKARLPVVSCYAIKQSLRDPNGGISSMNFTSSQLAFATTAASPTEAYRTKTFVSTYQIRVELREPPSGIEQSGPVGQSFQNGILCNEFIPNSCSGTSIFQNRSLL